MQYTFYYKKKHEKALKFKDVYAFDLVYACAVFYGSISAANTVYAIFDETGEMKYERGEEK